MGKTALVDESSDKTFKSKENYEHKTSIPTNQ